MKRFESIEEVAQILEVGDLFIPNVNFETVEEVVDVLMDLANSEEVVARRGDLQGLKATLSEEFLNARLIDIDQPKFVPDIEIVLEKANMVIPLSHRELSIDEVDEMSAIEINEMSEDDIEIMREDNILREEKLED